MEDDGFKRLVLHFSDTGRILYLSDKLFLPYESNDDESHDIINEMDPYFNYYSSYNEYASRCNYFIEASFMTEMTNCTDTQTHFSLGNFNIRSLRKYLNSFHNHLELLNHKLSVIGFTETWLKDEDWDLLNIPGYQNTKKHQSTRNGGGVALC